MLYFDIHGHDTGLLPFVLRAASMFRMPKDRGIKEISSSGLTGGIICAIGDPETFGFGNYKNDLVTILKQLSSIKKSISDGGAEIVLESDDIEELHAADKNGFILGIEGGDFIDEHNTLVEEAYKAGVRLIAPVHYSCNNLASVSMGWKGRIISEAEKTGLTPKGRRLVEKMNQIGMIIDLAHADEKTIADTAAITRAPVICSHTGPRALTGYLRHIDDESLKLIASTGGLIGLWPFLHKKNGTADTEAFKQQATYIRKLIGAEHMAIGTDFNGVPGYMKGYRDITESYKLIDLLGAAGFTEDEIEGIAGRNFIRVFQGVESNTLP